MRKHSLRLARLCLALALCFAFSGISFSQSDVGSITGFVRDQTGAVIPNAQVIITNEGTGEQHSVTADAQGHYTVPNLVPGLYALTAQAAGFKKFESTHNKLNAATTLSLDASLAVGQTTETVEVSASASQLQTESCSVEKNVTSQQIQARN